MAKKPEREPDFEAAEDFDPAPTATAPDPEKAALAARVAELEAQLAAARAGQVVNVVEGPPGALAGDFWRVRLKNGAGPAADHVVRAADPANAWDQYCRELGVLSAPDRPDVSPATPEEHHAAQARRFNKRPDEFTLPAGV